MLARLKKKLDICIKNIEYRHYFSRVRFFGEKNSRRLTKDAGKVFKKQGGIFLEEKKPKAD